MISFFLFFFLHNVFTGVTKGSWLTEIHIAGNLLFLQCFHGEVVSCYGRLDSICSICLAQMIWSELHANRNIWHSRLQQFDDWWDKYLSKGSGSDWCLGPVCEIAERWPKRWHILGWAQVVVFELLRALSGCLSCSMAQLSIQYPPHPTPSTLRISPEASCTFPISLSALQQLPNNARPDNRLPCQLQVCQPWACQITVSVNSGGGRVEWKERRTNVDWRGVERAGWDVLGWRRWRECDTRSHICTCTHTHKVWHIYHSSSDAGTRALPSMSLPLSFPSFFQVIPLVTSVLLISPYFSSPHSSLGLTATHVPSQSCCLKPHIALIKKRERDEEGKSNRQKNEMTFWALT